MIRLWLEVIFRERVADLVLAVAVQEVWSGLLELEVPQHILDVVLCSIKSRVADPRVAGKLWHAEQ